MGIVAGTGFARPGGALDLERPDLGPLKNRGPDNIGIHVSGNTALYHTRLAVIDDKQTSNQPIMSSGGRYALVCNGEIYNFRTLRTGTDFEHTSTSDCESVTACYHRSGTAGFGDLKGMFAFGLFDRDTRRLFVYRDAVGKKPLFYYASKDVFAFASNVNALTANLPGRSWTVDRASVRGFFTDGFVPPDRSLYDQIKPLLPGQLLEVNTETLEVRTSRVEPASADYGGFDLSEESVRRESERLLDAAIERRLAGVDRPVLLFSGGIDSTVLAKKMAQVSGKKLSCIGLRPLVPFTYDDAYARYAAARLGIRYSSCALSVRSLVRDLEHALSLLDQPLSIYSYYFVTYLTRKARESGNVLFMGEGGDEVFYGYDDVRAWFAPDGGGAVAPVLRVGPELPAGLSAWGRKQATQGLLGHSFVKTDKATAEQQMEARCPFLDWDLMHFMRKVPPALTLRSGVTKPFLKSCLSEFPRRFVERRKVGMAFNLRYLMFPHFRRFHSGIRFDALEEHGLSVADLRRFSSRTIFSNFDRFWKAFVLSTFLQ